MSRISRNEDWRLTQAADLVALLEGLDVLVLEGGIVLRGEGVEKVSHRDGRLPRGGLPEDRHPVLEVVRRLLLRVHVVVVCLLRLHLLTKSWIIIERES